MRVGIISNGVRAIQIAQALAVLEHGIEIIDTPKVFRIEARIDPDCPATAKRFLDNEPWRQKHKRRRGGRH